MNGYFARVTRCAGTTSEDGGSYSSNDIVCPFDETANVTAAPATSDSVRPTAIIVRISQERLSKSYAGDRGAAPGIHGRIVRNRWDFGAFSVPGPSCVEYSLDIPIFGGGIPCVLSHFCSPHPSFSR